MKFERSELGALFSKLRTAVPEVRAVGTDDAGILLSGSNACAHHFAERWELGRTV